MKISLTSAWRVGAAACGVALACAVLLLATSGPLAIVWDEGDTITRAEQIGQAAAPADAERVRGFFENLRAEEGWPFTTVREGHPPLAGILIALGCRIAPNWLDALTRQRFGPILFFALAAGAMFYRLQREYRVLSVSLMAVVAMLTMPRLFAHAHYATLDGPLTAAWVIAWAAYAPAAREWRWIVPFGLALGLVFCAKFTGWLAPLPFLTWAALYRDRRGLLAIALGTSVAVAVFVALNPPLWTEPLAGLRTFFDLNLHRAARPELNITTQFFGRLYNLDFPLPWYNTLVWTAITISPVPLVLGGLGIFASVRRWRTDRAAVLVLCQWGTLILARALPWAPPHDGERLILPSFAFYAALVGIGIGRALYRNSLLESQKIVAQGWAKVAMTIAILAPTFDSISYFGHGLSYYNRLVGGLRGAVALGMEPTYYWDAVDREALDWLAEHTPDGGRVEFSAYPPRNLELLNRWGLLPKLSNEPGPFRWYVVQRRPSAWRPLDQWLIEHEAPAFERSLSGVPLLDVFSSQQYQRAVDATDKERS